MESIDVLTGQHVTIKYQPASVVQRMLALLYDFIFIALYFAALSFIYFRILEVDIFEENTMDIVIYTIFCLPAICYHLFFETIFHGQTPGEMLLKIRVSNLDGSTPNFVAYFLRWLLLFIDIIPYGGLGAMLILFSKNHQRLGDLAAGTTVIKAIPASQFSIDEMFDHIDEKYQPAFREAEMLTSGQIRLISDLLEDPSDQGKVEDSIEQLTIKIKEKLHVQSDLDDRTFLKTIVNDYFYYTSQGI